MFSKHKAFIISFVILLMLIGGLLFLNMTVIRKTDEERSMSEGQIQLTGITSEVESNLYQAECTVEALASEMELYISENKVTEEQLAAFVSEKKKYLSEKTNGVGFSVYVAYRDKLYIEGFEPGDDFILEGREWYKGAKKQNGEIYLTAPYKDADTGKMCYSVSKLLSDGETVVSADYSMERAQLFIEEMGRENSGICMIVNDDGIVIGHTDPENVGTDYKTLPHSDIVRKVFALYGNSFKYESGVERYNVFSDKTSYGWYLIICVDSKRISGDISKEFSLIISFITLLSAVLVASYVFSYSLKVKSDKKSRYLISVMDKLSASVELTDEEKDALFSGNEQLIEAEDGEEQVSLQKNHKKYFTFVLLILSLTGISMLAVNSYSQLRSIDGRMQSEADEYYDQIKEWVTENKTRVNMLSQAFTAQPELVNDHDGCVKYINGFVGEYENISVAYIVNPEWERTVIMNNGWESDDPDWHVEERQWYLETMKSRNENGFNISTPYFDEQTGLYCVTLSQIVYDNKGSQIGVLGIDYYMDKLTSILGESYTDDGYAFLVDKDYNIINHPNRDYQITAVSAVNAGNLCYRNVLASDRDVSITDYDGTRKLCRIREETDFGFSVILVKNWSAMYGYMVISDIIIIATFGLCIMIVIYIMNRLTRMHIQVQEELKAAAEAANAANHAKDDFLANMSHEIRTPMNAVVGMTELILRENDISDTVKDYCCNIRNSGRNLLSIINDILDFSKITSGKLEIITDEFNIASTLNDSINMAVSKIGGKPLELIVMIDPAIPSGLIGDEIRIRQVIINIVTNAVKYSKEGCVFLNVYYYIQDEKHYLGVEVTDTGIGISENDIGKLFTSFQQLDTRKNRAVEGTGLGLNISKQLVELMGGEMTVSSVYGEGSTFAFKIPVGAADETPFLSVNDRESIRAAIYIDMSKYGKNEVREYYSKMLESLGIDCYIFCSLDEMKKRVTEKRFTHTVVGKNDYMSDKDFFKSLAGLIVVKERGDTEAELSGVKCIYKPFCAISFAAALNNETPAAQLGTDSFSSGFIAPEAEILVVDDNPVNLQVAEGLMRPYKMRVTTAQSAGEAMEKLEENRFDIVFMDHMMPEVDGVEATKIIREKDGDYFRTVPIIALTANAVRGARETFLTAGMNDFLAKPINPKALDKTLRTWLPKGLLEAYDRSDEDTNEELNVPKGDDIFSPQTGLFYAGGNTENYHSVLKSYLSKAEEKAAYIRKLADEKNWKDYVIEVHALKSTSITVGAKALSELAKELEAAGKEGNYKLAEEKNGELLDMYYQVSEKGREYILQADAAAPAEEEKEIQAADSAKVREWAGQLLEACDSFDSEQIESICKEAYGYSCNDIPLKPLFKEVLSAADDFEYDDAAQKAKDILDKFSQ